MSDDQPTLETVPEPVEGTFDKSEEGPGYVGTLEEDESKLLKSLRGVSSQIVLKIGQLEVQKTRLLTQLGSIEEQANSVVAKATERFGVDGGGSWTVNPEGKVFRANGA